MRGGRRAWPVFFLVWIWLILGNWLDVCLWEHLWWMLCTCTSHTTFLTAVILHNLSIQYIPQKTTLSDKRDAFSILLGRLGEATWLLSPSFQSCPFCLLMGLPANSWYPTRDWGRGAWGGIAVTTPWCHLWGKTGSDVVALMSHSRGHPKFYGLP